MAIKADDKVAAVGGREAKPPAADEATESAPAIGGGIWVPDAYALDPVFSSLAYRELVALASNGVSWRFPEQYKSLHLRWLTPMSRRQELKEDEKRAKEALTTQLNQATLLQGWTSNLKDVPTMLQETAMRQVSAPEDSHVGSAANESRRPLVRIRFGAAVDKRNKAYENVLVSLNVHAGELRRLHPSGWPFPELDVWCDEPGDVVVARRMYPKSLWRSHFMPVWYYEDLSVFVLRSVGRRALVARNMHHAHVAQRV